MPSGLSRAILKFDPTGLQVFDYAWRWVNQAISRALDNSDRIVRLPGACLTALKKVRNWQPSFVQNTAGCHHGGMRGLCGRHRGQHEALLQTL